MRVLCIDDETSFPKEIKEWLNPKFKDLDWTYVHTLALGIQALKEADNLGNPYDVLLLDLLLPGETLGLLSIPKLREDFPNLTVIGLTTGEDFNPSALSVGSRVFITKKTKSHEVILDTLRVLGSAHGSV